MRKVSITLEIPWDESREISPAFWDWETLLDSVEEVKVTKWEDIS